MPSFHFRFRPNPTVAVSAGTFIREQKFGLHSMGGYEWRVQNHRPRRSRSQMGRKEEQTQHELRQNVACVAILLR